MTEHRIPANLNPNRSITSEESPLAKDPTESSGTKSFSSLMQNVSPEQGADKSMVSPLQLPQMATAGPSNPANFLAQIQLAQNNMVSVQGQLAHPNLKLNAAQRNIIKTKLISANTNLESAHLKLGGSLDEKNDDAGDAPSKGSPGPIAQFLGFLSDGLNQLESTKHHIKNVSADGVLSPGDFLLIQLKLAKAQQEIEFTGVLLSKTIDGFKQLMSVQL